MSGGDFTPGERMTIGILGLALGILAALLILAAVALGGGLLWLASLAWGAVL